MTLVTLDHLLATPWCLGPNREFHNLPEMGQDAYAVL